MLEAWKRRRLVCGTWTLIECKHTNDNWFQHEKQHQVVVNGKAKIRIIKLISRHVIARERRCTTPA